jgi:peptidoglycan-N-acetylglucosamine deacetylase
MGNQGWWRLLNTMQNESVQDGYSDDEKRGVRISVIIPARNEEAYIAPTIAAVKNQDFSTYEIIIVDNGSSDDTAAVAEGLGCIVVYEPRVGLPRAREKGREAAHGDILVYIDADTLIPEGYLSAIYDYFQSNRGIVALSNPFLFDDGSLILNAATKLYFSFFSPLVNAISRALKMPTILFGGNFAVRKEALEKIQGFDTTIQFYGEDVHLSKRMAKVGATGFIHSLYTRTSARRYSKEGLVRTHMTYLLNLLSILLLNRSLQLPRFSPLRMVRFALSVLLVSIILYASIDPGSEIFGTVIYKLNSTDKVVALTFDDGPNGQSTRAILDILDREGIKATFFLIGKNVERYPDVAKEIVSRGHSIGNHSYSHPWKLPLENRHEVLKEVDRAEDAIYEATGTKPLLFRPPHGFRSPWMMSSIRKDGYKVVTWNDMTYDYMKQSRAKTIAKKIIGRARPGSIIVLHDGLNLNHGIDRKNTTLALSTIIRELKKKGYTFATLSDI